MRLEDGSTVKTSSILKSSDVFLGPKKTEKQKKSGGSCEKLRARNQYPWQAVRNKATLLSDSVTQRAHTALVSPSLSHSLTLFLSVSPASCDISSATLGVKMQCSLPRAVHRVTGNITQVLDESVRLMH